MSDLALSITGLRLALPPASDRPFAVEEVSLSIAPGQTLCVVGESGSGKSMLAHAVMGLLPRAVKAVAGSIRLSGRELMSLNDTEMLSVRGRDVGMIFQEPMTSLNPVMRIVDQIVETFEAHGRLDARGRQVRALELLTEVGLPDPDRIAKAYPHELSGGQRQRVMIAMALALKPKLLIADEPTTALDVTTQAQILNLIDELRRRHGTAVLFITHDFGVVADIADRIIVLQNGQMVEEGTREKVLRDPQNPYTRRLIDAVPSLRPPAAAAQRSTEPVLTVEGISKSYRKKSYFGPTRVTNAAQDVSFTLAKGETLGLVGESGSGKSTVGRCCLRLIEPDAGKIMLKGLNLTVLAPSQLRKVRSQIQMVFQDPYASLNPRHTVGRIISDGPVAHGVSRSVALRRTRELLDLVGLSAQAINRYPHEFSGGQRQRIGIARALALDPAVLVADEAVSALDVSVQAQILDLIKDVQRKFGLAILFVTHDLRVAAQICDRVIVMQRGRIVEQGSTGKLFASPRNAYTKQLLAAVPGGRHFENLAASA
jgi:peptide/nickel transport system ATP-binding protein